MNLLRCLSRLQNVQGKVNFLDEDHADVLSVDSESTHDNALMDKNHPSTRKESMDENYPLNKDKSTDSKELRKLKKKYCHLDNFVAKKEIDVETRQRLKRSM